MAMWTFSFDMNGTFWRKCLPTLLIMTTEWYTSLRIYCLCCVEHSLSYSLHLVISLNNSRIFVPSCQRPNLRSLSLKFGQGPSGNLTEADIYKTCLNLIFLNLEHFYGDDKSFLALWEHIPFLDSLGILGCPKITENELTGYNNIEKNINERGILA